MRFDKNKLSLTMKLTRDLTAVRVIAMELVRGSCYSRTTCHCETCRIHGVAISLPHGSCHSRWSEKIFPRSLNVSLPRATLVAWWKQSHCKLATISLLLDRRTTFAMTIHTAFAMTIHTAFAMTTRTALGHANSHKCGWRCSRLGRFVCDLKICFQITFPFFISILFSN